MAVLSLLLHSSVLTVEAGTRSGGQNSVGLSPRSTVRKTYGHCMERGTLRLWFFGCFFQALEEFWCGEQMAQTAGVFPVPKRVFPRSGQKRVRWKRGKKLGKMFKCLH
jgi:hypothetical protein